VLVGLKSGRALIASMPELARRRQLDDLVGDATTDQRAEPKKEPLIPSTMVRRWFAGWMSGPRRAGPISSHTLSGRLVIEPLDVGFAAVPFVLVGIPTKLGTELRLPWLGTNVRIPF
jgi:hypothetical protein